MDDDGGGGGVGGGGGGLQQCTGDHQPLFSAFITFIRQQHLLTALGRLCGAPAR